MMIFAFEKFPIWGIHPKVVMAFLTYSIQGRSI